MECMLTTLENWSKIKDMIEGIIKEKETEERRRERR